MGAFADAAACTAACSTASEFGQTARSVTLRFPDSCHLLIRYIHSLKENMVLLLLSVPLSLRIELIQSDRLNSFFYPGYRYLALPLLFYSNSSIFVHFWENNT
jgi:hypothetical protein